MISINEQVKLNPFMLRVYRVPKFNSNIFEGGIWHQTKAAGVGDEGTGNY